MMYTLRYQSSGDSQVRRVCPLVVTEALLTRPLWPWLVLLRELMQIPESGPTQSLWLHTKNPVSLYATYSTVATLQEVTWQRRNREDYPNLYHCVWTSFLLRLVHLRYFIAVKVIASTVSPTNNVTFRYNCHSQRLLPFLCSISF